MVTDSELNEYFNHAVYRDITVKVADDFCQVEENPDSVFFVSLPGDVVTDRDEIFRTLARPLYGKEGFSIEQRTSIVECGASGAGQEILIGVASGLATSLIIYLAEQTKAWLAGREPVEDSFNDDVACLENISKLLKNFYMPVSPLTASNQSSTPEQFFVTMTDATHKRFDCSIDRRTMLVSIKRVPISD
jgi:hypothetical protein